MSGLGEQRAVRLVAGGLPDFGQRTLLGDESQVRFMRRLLYSFDAAHDLPCVILEDRRDT